MNRPSKKPKKQRQLKQAFSATNSSFVLDGLNKVHKGKRILIPAAVLYPPNPVPEGEETTLFQYSVKSVNSDCTTATIDFDELCIKEGDDRFQDYPSTSDESTLIENYDLNRLKDDHENFNKHMGQVTRKLNDAAERRKKTHEKTVTRSVQDMSDLT